MKVTMQNLRLSFPEKSEEDLKMIARKYYRNLCDSILETVKLFSISSSELEKRMKVNWEMFDTMTEQNRNGQAYMSHQFNWEWATVLCNWRAPRRFTGLYMPLTNKAFDRLYLKLRGTQWYPVDKGTGYAKRNGTSATTKNTLGIYC